MTLTRLSRGFQLLFSFNWLEKLSPRMKHVKIGFFCCFNRTVHYEGGAVSVHARSLWRLETLRVA